MATKTFEELKQMAIQIRDEKTNKQNTATRIGTQMLEHLNKLEQEYYNIENIDEQFKGVDTQFKNLETDRIKKTTELNISVLYPTNGVGGTNKYELAGAISQVDSKYRTIVGLKITFINNTTSKTETWKYNGETFTDVSKWKQINDYERLDEIEKSAFDNVLLYSVDWNTDVQTTRDNVPEKIRKEGLILTYIHPVYGQIFEKNIRYSSGYTWNSDNNWAKISSANSLSPDSSNGVDVYRNISSKYYTDRTQRFVIDFPNPLKTECILKINVYNDVDTYPIVLAIAFNKTGYLYTASYLCDKDITVKCNKYISGTPNAKIYIDLMVESNLRIVQINELIVKAKSISELTITPVQELPSDIEWKDCQNISPLKKIQKSLDDFSSEIQKSLDDFSNETSLNIDKLSSRISENGSNIEELRESLLTKRDITSSISTDKGGVNRLISNSDGSIIRSSGGGVLLAFDVSNYNGAKLNIKRAATTMDSAQWTISNKVGVSEITADTILLFNGLSSEEDLDDTITVPEGAIQLTVFTTNSSDIPVSVFLVEEKLSNIPIIDNRGFPTYDEWSKPDGVVPQEYEVFNVINTGKGNLCYGGANLLYKKKAAGIGDSLLQGGQWLNNLAVLAGMNISVYAAGGRGTTPTPATYTFYNDHYSSMQDLANRLIQEVDDVDIIFFENVNDKGAMGNAEAVGDISDVPFMVSQYIKYENGYTSADNAIAGFSADFNDIIATAEFKRGSIAQLLYTTTSYKLTLSGTATNGIIKITIDETEAIIDVVSSDSLDTIAEKIAIFEFPGYSVTSDGSIVTFTPISGSYSRPTVGSNTAGVIIDITDTTNTSSVYFYFKGLISSDWTNPEMWENTVPTLYSIYKGLVEKLMTNYPKARIVFMQPVMALTGTYGNPPTFADGSPDIYNTNKNISWNKCRDIQQEICKLYNIECIDVQSKSSINLINAQLGGWYGSDKTHYLLATQQRTAEIIYEYLK